MMHTPSFPVTLPYTVYIDTLFKKVSKLSLNVNYIAFRGKRSYTFLAIFDIENNLGTSMQ